jgi:hypothetical protein
VERPLDQQRGGLRRSLSSGRAFARTRWANNPPYRLHRRRRLLDFDVSSSYIVAMTKLLDEAVEAVRRLPSDDQDDIARAIMQLAGSDLPAPVVLSPEEREAIARSKAAADRGEFATDEQVRAVWAKHGL